MESYRTTMERTKAHLDQGDEVLEVGCGTGSTALLLAPNVKSLTASDFSDGMIKIATDKLTAPEAPGNVSFRQAVIGDHVAGGERYDAVLAFNFLHLVDDVPGAIEQIRTLLKPGGLFVLADSVQFGDYEGIDGVLEYFPHGFHEPYYNSYLAWDVDSAAIGQGFVKERETLAFLTKVTTWRRPL